MKKKKFSAKVTDKDMDEAKCCLGFNFRLRKLRRRNTAMGIHGNQELAVHLCPSPRQCSHLEMASLDPEISECLNEPT